MNPLSLLLRPLDYLRIKHDAKQVFDIWIPLTCAVVLTAFALVIPKPISILDKFGLASGLNGLLQVLTGFYIAALAAIATFQKSGMDQVMAGTPPRLLTTVRGVDKEIELTRRRFLCLMFGYLALLSLTLYVGGLAAILLRDTLHVVIPDKFHRLSYGAALFVYLLLVSNLLVTTLLGLYYMSDRIHRSDVRMLDEPSDEAEKK